MSDPVNERETANEPVNDEEPVTTEDYATEIIKETSDPDKALDTLAAVMLSQAEVFYRRYGTSTEATLQMAYHRHNELSIPLNEAMVSAVLAIRLFMARMNSAGAN